MLEGRCATTAMGIMPHIDVEKALSLALTLEVPFWPQLFRVGFSEDSYVQASHDFPGLFIDERARSIVFDIDACYRQLADYAEASSDPDFFALSPEQSQTYHRFLTQDLSQYVAVHGQLMGPVSLGFKVLDHELKPIIYREDVRALLFDFLRNKVNAQYRQLRGKNAHAFVWVDEPGIDLVFSAFSGYTAEMAKMDLRTFFEGIEGPKGVHLCGNPDWDLLLDLNLDILSIDAYHWGPRFALYADGVRRFLARGGILSWGIVPTTTDDFERETSQQLAGVLEGFWDRLAAKGVDRDRLVHQSLLAPATCCLLNADKTTTIERAFATLREVSCIIRDSHSI